LGEQYLYILFDPGACQHCCLRIVGGVSGFEAFHEEHYKRFYYLCVLYNER